MVWCDASPSIPPVAAGAENLRVRADYFFSREAVCLHAERRRQVEAQIEREREEKGKLVAELEFRRERLLEAERGEAELRVLMAQSVAAQQSTARELEALRELATPQRALPAPKKARWWAPWRRE